MCRAGKICVGQERVFQVALTLVLPSYSVRTHRSPRPEHTSNSVLAAGGSAAGGGGSGEEGKVVVRGFQ